MKWMRDNAPTLVGWVFVLCTLVWSTSQQVTEVSYQAEAIRDTSSELDIHATRITKLEADVRVMTEVVDRQERLLGRQEDNVRDLDRLVVALKTVMERQ